MPPGLSGGLSGELPGGQEACLESCQAVSRAARRSGGQSDSRTGQILETFGQFRGSSSPQPSRKSAAPQVQAEVSTV